ncbi:serine hydrolase [Candidatus Uhrbacteria bacterium]|nr:serine hydrolase [Candidatus Uhrbacteria bacterium]
MNAEAMILLVGSLAMQASRQMPTGSLNGLPVAKYVAVTSEAPTKKNQATLGIDVDARAAVVMDVASGQTLFEKDSHVAYPIASLTKIISAMVFLDGKPDLDDQVTFLAEDDAIAGKTVIPTGERLTKREVLSALLIGSVNEAANVLSRTSGGREAFVAAMNRKARAIGMEHAVFYDPSGLDARNKASARDVALALRAALSYPDLRKTTEQPNVNLVGRATNRKYQIKTTNLLLSSDLNRGSYRIVAAKTGTLAEAGFCMAQATRDAEGHEVIAVVLGGGTHFTRFQDVKALTYWSFQNFVWNGRQARLIREN